MLQQNTRVSHPDQQHLSEEPGLDSLGLVSWRPAQYAPGTIKSGIYGRCLDLNPDSSKEVYNHHCHGGDNQMWWFDGDQLKNLYLGSGWCLDMALGSGNGVHGGNRYGNLYMSRCTRAWNQKFEVRSGGIWVKGQNRCMDQSLGSWPNVYAPGCAGSLNPNQRWTIGGKITVRGRWQPLQQITGLTEVSEETGTTKSKTSTKSSEWSMSVTRSVEAGFEVEGFSAKASVSATVGRTMVQTEGRYWATDKTSRITQIVEPREGEKYLWQWQMEVSTADVEDVTVKTNDLAKTAGKWQMPKCAPGWCLDSPRCQSCMSEGRLV